MCTTYYFKYISNSTTYSRHIIHIIGTIQKNYNIYVDIPKFKELIYVPIPLKKMELINSLVPLKRNQFQESLINNSVLYIRIKFSGATKIYFREGMGRWYTLCIIIGTH